MEKKLLNLLCVGDTLAVGSPCMHPGGIIAKSRSIHPYVLRLVEKLHEELPEYEVDCEVDGKEGDHVVDGVLMLRVIIQLAERPFDWSIVLGGSNDIARNESTGDIIKSLRDSWSVPLSTGAKVIAMTIPEHAMDTEEIKDRRNEVNIAIKQYSRPNFFCFDLCHTIPYHTMDPVDRSKYWDKDGKHLSISGYNLMGEKMAEMLIEIMTRRPA
ncbi:SGNH hydrolase-type esterase domain-containing protein [Hypoxylon crocopeplum]|nr:SGNH hydrolase-type esterase domain-containing protein [Hypoxylon crocopeplum]